VAGKLEGNRPLRTPKYTWEDNIKLGLRKIGWGGIDWIDLAHQRIQWKGPLKCCEVPE
jgi:hypothetical protein